MTKFPFTSSLTLSLTSQKQLNFNIGKLLKQSPLILCVVWEGSAHSQRAGLAIPVGNPIF